MASWHSNITKGDYIMRTKIGLALVALLVIGIVATAVSQPMKGRGKMPRTVLPGQGKGWMGITPPLTAEQMEKISALRTDHQKNSIDLRADLQKKRLDLRTLMTATEPNEKKINGVIEEMGSLRTQLQKQRVSHWLKVREILTPEQRTALKACGLRFGGRRGWGHPRRGQGQGPNRGIDPCWK